MGERLAGPDARPVHELDRHRQHPGPDDVRDAGPRHLARGEPHQHRPRPLGLRAGSAASPRSPPRAAPPTRRPRPSRSYPGASRCAPPSSTTVPSISTMVTPEQVVGRHPVLQAMRPARVHRDVAGDGAGELARRVRRVEEPLLLHRPGDAQVGPPGLHPDEAVLDSRSPAPVHPRHARAARSPPSAATRPRGSSPPRAAPPAPPPRGRPAAPPPPPRSRPAAPPPAAGSDRRSARRTRRRAPPPDRGSPRRPAAPPAAGARSRPCGRGSPASGSGICMWASDRTRRR